MMLPSALAALVVMGSLLSTPTAAVPIKLDYKDALDKSLLFFEAQRSGKLPPGQRVKWRSDSGLKDGFMQGVDLVGGYYDSGDHVKFGLPMAFAATMLSWSVVEFEKEIATSNQLEHALDAIRWGTDYFIKAHTKPNVLWGQVGDGDSDHSCWERAEDMTTPRTAYAIDSEHPGSEIAGETAAALAAASIAFKPYNSTYSQLLLWHAKQLFTFADTFRGQYDQSIACARKYYPSATGYSDELLWAAAWLFKATDEDCYLKYVVDNAVSMGGTGWAVKEFSWDNKYAGLQVLLSKILMEGVNEAYHATLKQYQAKAEFFMCACLQKNNGYNVAMTPGGLLFVDEWNNMQYVASSSFLLVVYADYLSMTHSTLTCPDGQIQPPEIIKFAQLQADYILGKNPKSLSYMVGYQANYPAYVHHRGASIASKSIVPSLVGCIDGFEKWFDNKQHNPNVIIGALVGGPNQRDEFSDLRSSYEQTEPSVAGNAPLVGLFARISCLSESSAPLPKYSATTPAASVRAPIDPKYSATTPAASVVAPIEFVHSITHTWASNGIDSYRHKVIVKNTCGKPITELKLSISNLSGPIYGLAATAEKDVYELPLWIKLLKPGSQFIFTYVQKGPQALVSILSYH